MTTTDINQEIIFTVPPIEVYDAIMNEQTHGSFTDSDVSIKDEVGTKFTAYNGYIEGWNVMLERGVKIVQNWRANEPDWGDSHFSTVFFDFEPFEKGTRLKFTHKDVPIAQEEALAQGWFDYYWEPMKMYFEENLMANNLFI